MGRVGSIWSVSRSTVYLTLSMSGREKRREDGGSMGGGVDPSVRVPSLLEVCERVTRGWGWSRRCWICERSSCVWVGGSVGQSLDRSVDRINRSIDMIDRTAGAGAGAAARGQPAAVAWGRRERRRGQRRWE